MARAKSKTTEPEPKRSPLSAFVHHQQKAVGETGKAIGSLFPKEFREHTGKAFEEGKAGVTALINGVVDGVEQVLEKLRCSSGEEAESKTKVKVEVEDNE
jgi:hypothetical protein